MKKEFAVAFVALALSGCASIFSGTTQDVAVRTTQGAKFSVTNSYGSRVASGTVGEDALASANLVRSVGYFSPQAYKMKISKIGYHPKIVEVDPGMNGWYFGNLLFGGFVGMVIVDPLTGAMFRLVPRTDDAELQPTGEDIAALEAEAAYIEKSFANPISRHDYTARQLVGQQACQPIGNPEVVGFKTYEEKLIFACKGGRSLTVTCSSMTGCKS